MRASPACISPSAMMLTSLSTTTGQPRCWESTDRTGNWFQPGMIGGATGTPSRNETGPGTPTPAPCRSTALPLERDLADELEHHGQDRVRAVPYVDGLGRAARARPSGRR